MATTPADRDSAVMAAAGNRRPRGLIRRQAVMSPSGKWVVCPGAAVIGPVTTVSWERSEPKCLIVRQAGQTCPIRVSAADYLLL
ncbi:hypothetical protein FJTKL_03953 [Diaporthe vaccinii]|uniref:Uncharacterized protein n=1 Tax=Diaporthe vaccinii TaxID=105482 RepID=A0ABR4F1P2_9PEZI